MRRCVGSILLSELMIFLLFCLMPAAAFASSLTGSVHDLYSGSVAPGQADEDAASTKACVYCHTPSPAHPPQAARWDTKALAGSFSVWSGISRSDNPTALGESSLLCWSCHDGTVAADAAGTVPQFNPAPKPTAFETFGPGVLADADPLGGPGGPEHTHPVGIPYLPASDLVPAPAGGQFPNGVRLIDGKVECMSCHNPHSADARPFLAASNSGSALCCTCHIK